MVVRRQAILIGNGSKISDPRDADGNHECYLISEAPGPGSRLCSPFGPEYEIIRSSIVACSSSLPLTMTTFKFRYGYLDTEPTRANLASLKLTIPVAIDVNPADEINKLTCRLAKLYGVTNTAIFQVRLCL